MLMPALSPAQEAEATALGGKARLADIRIEIQNLDFNLQVLRWELVQSENDRLGDSKPNTGSVLQRIDQIELELRSHLRAISEIERRINQEVAASKVKIEDLRERLRRLETGTSLQSEDALDTTVTDNTEEPEARIPSFGMTDEDVLFNQALEHFVTDEFEAANALFAEFIDRYPNSIRIAEVYFYQGEGFAKLGQWQQASKAFLESFLIDNTGPLAPSILYRLGQVLAEWERIDESCQMFQNLIDTFPNSIEAENSLNYLDRLKCNELPVN